MRMCMALFFKYRIPTLQTMHVLTNTRAHTHTHTHTRVRTHTHTPHTHTHHTNASIITTTSCNRYEF